MERQSIKANINNTFDVVKKLHRIQYVTIEYRDQLDDDVFQYIVGTCDDIIQFLEERDRNVKL
jgi:hypothetical protein